LNIGFFVILKQTVFHSNFNHTEEKLVLHQDLIEKLVKNAPRKGFVMNNTVKRNGQFTDTFCLVKATEQKVLPVEVPFVEN
jgi:hypothetical protein